jgi:hypothetical protein
VQLEALELQDCSITDDGLLAALRRCSQLRRLTINASLLVTRVGVEAAAAALQRSGGQLEELLLDGEALSVAEPHGRQGRPATPSKGARTAAVIRDERITYTLDELLQLRPISMNGSEAVLQHLPADLAQPAPQPALV